MRGAVDRRHPRDEHGEDQERADLHDELEAVRHALRPHRRAPRSRASASAQLGAHRPREHRGLGRVAARRRDRRAGTPQPRPRMSVASSAMLTTLPASDARIGARLSPSPYAPRGARPRASRSARPASGSPGTRRRSDRRAARRTAAPGPAARPWPSTSAASRGPGPCRRPRPTSSGSDRARRRRLRHERLARRAGARCRSTRARSRRPPPSPTPASSSLPTCATNAVDASVIVENESIETVIGQARRNQLAAG